MGKQDTDMNVFYQVLRDRLANFLGKSHSGDRDLYEAFGYPDEIDLEVLVGFYRRNDIANRIVKAFPQATWRELPVIGDEEGESPENESEGFSKFSASVFKLFDKHNAIRNLERGDRLASLGRFGLIFFGFGDGLAPSEPLPPGNHKLLFITPYSELGVKVQKWDTSVNSPRFGLPEIYNITRSSLSMDDGSSPNRSFTVHHSRVIHLAEYLDQDEVYGIPRLLPIANRLYDLEKVIGGAAETFWLTANRGIAYWADKEATLDDDEIAKIKTQADEMAHNLRRHVVGTGMTAQILGSESPDPEPNVTMILDLIAGGVGIPKRILIGSERGELSSEQDENNWAQRTMERRNSFAAPSILKPTVQLLINTGNVEQPQGDWHCGWPDERSLSPAAEADIAIKRSTALATYANSPDSQLIVPPQEFRKDIMGLDPDSEYELEFPEDIDESDLDLNTNVDDPSDLKTLFAFRRVRNHAAIRRWAKKNGLTDLNKFMHVTLCHSIKKVDWLKVWTPIEDPEENDGSMIVQASDQRAVDIFGGNSNTSNRCIVLRFASSQLQMRAGEFKWQGAASDYAELEPHITLTATIPKGFKPENVEPYKGVIVLEAEEFREIDDEVE